MSNRQISKALVPVIWSIFKWMTQLSLYSNKDFQQNQNALKNKKTGKGISKIISKYVHSLHDLLIYKKCGISVFFYNVALLI